MKPKTHINDGHNIIEREMTDEEYANYLAEVAQTPPLEETPTE
jgi:hypothetical protein